MNLPPDQQAIRDKCYHPSGEFVEFRKDSRHELRDRSITGKISVPIALLARQRLAR
jgi:hypothetical protein